MTQPIDPVTTALTGKLPFYLLLAAALTFPIAVVVLRLYARAVRRSMRQAHGAPAASDNRAPAGPNRPDAEGPAATLYDLSEPHGGSAGSAALFSHLVREPRRAAIVYAVAGA